MNEALIALLLVAPIFAALVTPRRLAYAQAFISFICVCTSGLLFYRAIQLPHLQLVQLSFGLRLALEPISALFLALTSFLWMITSIYLRFHIKHVAGDKDGERLSRFIALSMCAVFGIAMSADLMSTFVCYELLTLLSYPLLVSNVKDVKSARLYVLTLMITSNCLFLPGVMCVRSLCNGNADFVSGGLLAQRFHGDAISTALVTSLGIAFLYGTAKTGIVPFHSWLREAISAPIPVSALLHSVAVVNSGVLIMAKIVAYSFGPGLLIEKIYRVFGVSPLTILTCISTITAAAISLRQTSIKKLLAYSTIGQLSLCLTSISLGYEKCLIAGVICMCGHAVAKITLFFATGISMHYCGVDKIEDLRGLSARLPNVALAFAIAVLAILGVPIIGSFVGKTYILKCAFENASVAEACVMAVTIGCSSLASSRYYMKLLLLWYAPTNTARERKIAVDAHSWVPLLITCSIVLGYSGIAGFLTRTLVLG